MSRSCVEIVEDNCDLTPLMRIESYTLCVVRLMYGLGQSTLGELAAMSSSALCKMENFEIKEGHTPKSKVMKVLGLSYCFMADVDNRAIQYYENCKNELLGTLELAEFVEENKRSKKKEHYELCRACHADAMKVVIALAIMQFFGLQVPELEAMIKDPYKLFSTKEKHDYIKDYYEQVKNCKEVKFAPQKEQLVNFWEVFEDLILKYRNTLNDVRKVYKARHLA